jgi:hypothetical protein
MVKLVNQSDLVLQDGKIAMQVAADKGYLHMQVSARRGVHMGRNSVRHSTLAAR